MRRYSSLFRRAHHKSKKHKFSGILLFSVPRSSSETPPDGSDNRASIDHLNSPPESWKIGVICFSSVTEKSLKVKSWIGAAKIGSSLISSAHFKSVCFSAFSCFHDENTKRFVSEKCTGFSFYFPRWAYQFITDWSLRNDKGGTSSKERMYLCDSYSRERKALKTLRISFELLKLLFPATFGNSLGSE